MATSDISKSPLYIDSTNSRVGVGTTSPTGNANANAVVLEVNSSGANPPEILAGGQNAEISIAGGSSASYLWSTGAYPLIMATNAAEVVRVETGGLTFTPATNNLYTVSGTLSYYGTTNNVYLNGASSGGMIMSGNGNRYQYVYLNSASDSVMITTNTVERLGIDSSGRVTMPSQPAFYARGLPSKATANGILLFSNTTHNIGNHYNTSTGLFTAPVSGRYLFTFNCLSQDTGAGYIYAGLSVNGSVASIVQHYKTTSTDTGQSVGGSAVLDISANDVVGVYAWAASINIYSGNGYTWWSGYLIG